MRRCGSRSGGKWRRKLLLDEKVEIRSFDEGIKGSWNTGVIVGCAEGLRYVKYDNIYEENSSRKLVEEITVSNEVEGCGDKMLKDHRGNIRPLPPHRNVDITEIKYGMCVDVYFEDAWWEGVIFDENDGSPVRYILFPDQGDQREFNIKSMRHTFDWSEALGDWRPRGCWILLKLLQKLEKEEPLPVSVREIWYDISSTDTFRKIIGDWVLGSRSTWKTLALQAIKEALTVAQGQTEEALSGFVGDALSSDGTALALGPLNAEAETRSVENGQHLDEICLIEDKESMPSKKLLKTENVPWHLQVVGAEYCDDAIAEFLLCLKGRNPDLNRVRGFTAISRGLSTKVRKHLAALGWNVYFGLLGVNKLSRFLYVSPSGKKFFSLKKVCLYLTRAKETKKKNVKGGTDVRHSHNDSQYLSVASPVSEAPERELSTSEAALHGNRLQSLCDYIRCMIMKKRKKERGALKKVAIEKGIKAKEHLAYLGWKLGSKVKNGRRILHYISPKGKCLFSLFSACKAYLRETVVDNSSESMLLLDLLQCEELGVKELDKGPARQCPERRNNGPVFSSFSSDLPDTPQSSLSEYCICSHKSKKRKRTQPCIKLCDKSCNGISKTSYKTRQQAKKNIGSSVLIRRSLLKYHERVLQKNKRKNFPHKRVKGDLSTYPSDVVCSMCQEGGMLVMCDSCPSSFHLECVVLEDVPQGRWYCSSCRCTICGLGEYNKDDTKFVDETKLYCDQCEREYHVGCLKRNSPAELASCPKGYWFCNKTCEKIFCCLQGHVGKLNPTSMNGLSWTLLRSSKEDHFNFDRFDAETRAEHDTKLQIAADILHECFTTFIDPHTKRDHVDDLVFNEESGLRRWNFWGFYTMILEKDEEPVCVATFRVFGDKAAELPFIGTSIQYRRQGMCRLLVDELEKLLLSLGVDRLLLPAIPQLLETWTNSFGFTKMTRSDRVMLSEYIFLNFQGTIMCEKRLKHLRSSSPTSNPSGENANKLLGTLDPSNDEMDCENQIVVSGVFNEVQSLDFSL